MKAASGRPAMSALTWRSSRVPIFAGKCTPMPSARSIRCSSLTLRSSGAPCTR